MDELEALLKSCDVPSVIHGVNKVCGTCLQVKPLSEFYTRRDRKQGDAFGKVSKCKECSINNYRKWYRTLSKDRKEEVLKKGRKASYMSRHKGRITEQEADQLAESRIGICEICNKPTEVYLDHCHKTNKRRGFLCYKCNTILGLAQDDVRVLANAVTYLYEKSRLY